MTYRRVDINPFNSITSLLGLILFFVVLYYIAKGFFFILGLITPGLLIGAAILNWQVYPDYLKWLWSLLKSNPIMGIIAAILSVVGLPVVSGFLFFKALFRYRMKKAGNLAEERREQEYVDYEEIEDEPITPLELPEMEKRQRKDNEYDGLFD